MLTIETKDIKELFSKAIPFLEFHFPEKKLAVANNLYLTLLHPFDIAKKEEPAIGSLHDDYESLKLLLADKERPFTSVDLDRLAALLKAISQEINPA